MKRIILAFTLALIVVGMAVNAAPAVAHPALGILIQQDQGKDQSQEDQDKDQSQDQGKDQGKSQEKKGKENLPKSGGISPSSVALLGLGGVALLIGGGVLVRRIAR